MHIFPLVKPIDKIKWSKIFLKILKRKKQEENGGQFLTSCNKEHKKGSWYQDTSKNTVNVRRCFCPFADTPPESDPVFLFSLYLIS